jgi:ubiquinone biosynthesis protein
MHDQIGWRAIERRLRDEAPFLATALPLVPRLIYQRLNSPPPASETAMREFASMQRVRNRWLALIALLVAVTAAILIWRAW